MKTVAFSQNTIHIVVDMQRLFAEKTVWYTPAMAGILPNVLRLCEAHPLETFFARFLVPQNAESADGHWKNYYRRWTTVTLDALDPELLGLVPPLAAIARETALIDKYTYSVFGSPGFLEKLNTAGTDTIIFSGVETDVCVYASVLDAVDAGYRVILAADALTSSDLIAHTAVMSNLVPRLTEQVEVLSTAEILKIW